MMIMMLMMLVLVDDDKYVDDVDAFLSMDFWVAIIFSAINVFRIKL